MVFPTELAGQPARVWNITVIGFTDSRTAQERRHFNAARHTKASGAMEFHMARAKRCRQQGMSTLVNGHEVDITVMDGLHVTTGARLMVRGTVVYPTAMERPSLLAAS